MNYQHKEAFCLMFYENEETRNGFVIWNSRDGVTPFIVGEDGVHYQHNHWSMDMPVTNQDYIQRHILVPGQRIFRDMTASEARECAIRRVQSAKGTQYEVEEGSDYWNELVEHLTKDFTGEPTVVKVQTAGVLP